MRIALFGSGWIMDYHARGYGAQACFLHDPLAVGAVLWPELLRTEHKRVDVETRGTLTRGMTVADFRPSVYRAPAVPNGEVNVAGNALRETLIRVKQDVRDAQPFELAEKKSEKMGGTEPHR